MSRNNLKVVRKPVRTPDSKPVIELENMFQSDAEKRGLPLINTTHSGAKPLPTDEILDRAYYRLKGETK